MFYEGVGTLLQRAGDTLAAADSDRDDERSKRQARIIATLVRRFGAIQTDLFGALEQEIAILEQTRDGLVTALGELAAPLPLAAQHSVATAADTGGGPLDSYRALMTEIDRCTVVLHGLDLGDAAVQRARRQLRRGLAARAAVEGLLVDKMLAVK